MGGENRPFVFYEQKSCENQRKRTIYGRGQGSNVECICICIFATLKLLNFTILLHLLYTLASQSIEYHRLRQARGEGHDMHQTEKESRVKKFAHLRLALTLIQCHFMCIA